MPYPHQTGSSSSNSFTATQQAFDSNTQVSTGSRQSIQSNGLQANTSSLTMSSTNPTDSMHLSGFISSAEGSTPSLSNPDASAKDNPSVSSTASAEASGAADGAVSTSVSGLPDLSPLHSLGSDGLSAYGLFSTNPLSSDSSNTLASTNSSQSIQSGGSQANASSSRAMVSDASLATTSRPNSCTAVGDGVSASSTALVAASEAVALASGSVASMSVSSQSNDTITSTFPVYPYQCNLKEIEAGVIDILCLKPKNGEHIPLDIVRIILGYMYLERVPYKEILSRENQINYVERVFGSYLLSISPAAQLMVASEQLKSIGKLVPEVMVRDQEWLYLAHLIFENVFNSNPKLLYQRESDGGEEAAFRLLKTILSHLPKSYELTQENNPRFYQLIEEVCKNYSTERIRQLLKECRNNPDSDSDSGYTWRSFALTQNAICAYDNRPNRKNFDQAINPIHTTIDNSNVFRTFDMLNFFWILRETIEKSPCKVEKSPCKEEERERERNYRLIRVNLQIAKIWKMAPFSEIWPRATISYYFDRAREIQSAFTSLSKAKELLNRGTACDHQNPNEDLMKDLNKLAAGLAEECGEIAQTLPKKFSTDPNANKLSKDFLSLQRNFLNLNVLNMFSSSLFSPSSSSSSSASSSSSSSLSPRQS